MKINFLNSKQKKELLRKINDEFGIEEIPYLLIETGKEKVRGFSGTMTRDEMEKLSEMLRVEIIGLSLFRVEKNEEIRLGLDATHIFSDKIQKNIFEIDKDQLEMWIRGDDIKIESDKEPGLYVVKCENDFLGCGRFNGDVLFNFVPKERRIRK